MVLLRPLFVSSLIDAPYDNKIFRVSRFLLPFLNTLSDLPFLLPRLFLTLLVLLLLISCYESRLCLAIFRCLLLSCHFLCLVSFRFWCCLFLSIYHVNLETQFLLCTYCM